MKTLFSLLFFLSLSLTISAQVKIESVRTNAHGNTEDSFKAVAVLKNTTNKTIHLKVERVDDNMRDNWYASIFYGNESYSPFVENFRVKLTPKSSKRIGVEFFAEGTPGSSSVELLITSVNSKDNVRLSQSFFGTASTKNQPLPSEALKIFPNPAYEYFKVSGNENIRKLVIYNIIGKKMMEYPVNHAGQQFEVTDLSRGIYLVRFFDDEENIIDTLRLNIVKP
ncbi:MAG: T9SS type A sorting domain-containing protein [Bacteroidota bacterium]